MYRVSGSCSFRSLYHQCEAMHAPLTPHKRRNVLLTTLCFVIFAVYFLLALCVYADLGRRSIIQTEVPYKPFAMMEQADRKELSEENIYTAMDAEMRQSEEDEGKRGAIQSLAVTTQVKERVNVQKHKKKGRVHIKSPEQRITREYQCTSEVCIELLSAFDRVQYDNCTDAVAHSTSSAVAKHGTCRFMNGTNRTPVALVSLEGSGNTWVRGLLEKTTGICTGSSFPKNPHCDVSLRSGGFNGESVKSGSVIAVKTHASDLSWTNSSGTQLRRDSHPLYGAAILIIRNPLDALVAEWNRRNSIDSKDDPHTASVPQRFFLSNPSWSSYVRKRIMVWKKFFANVLLNKYKMPVLAIKYEDLRTDCLQQVKRMLSFLKIPFTEAELEKKLATGFQKFMRNSHMTFEHFTTEQRDFVAQVVQQTIELLAMSKVNLNITDYIIS